MTHKSFAVFLSQARGSLYELETQIELARDLGLAGKSQADAMIAEAADISRMLHGLLAKVRQDG
jgi:four helix bundle protein